MTLIAFVVLILFVDHTMLSFRLLAYLLIGVLMATGASFGIALFIASANIRYRDFRYIVPFFLQALFFLSPIIAPLTLYGSGRIGMVLSMNPLAGSIDLIRSALAGTPANWHQIAIGCLVMTVLILAGLAFFRKVESQCADIL
jgi:lipopolysaccharide transport system permease protein